MIGWLDRLRRMLRHPPDPQAQRLTAATAALDRRTRAAVSRAERALEERRRIDREMHAADVAMFGDRPEHR